MLIQLEEGKLQRTRFVNQGSLPTEENRGGKRSSLGLTSRSQGDSKNGLAKQKRMIKEKEGDLGKGKKYQRETELKRAGSKRRGVMWRGPREERGGRLRVSREA